MAARLHSRSNHGGNGISCISCRLFPAPGLPAGVLCVVRGSAFPAVAFPIEYITNKNKPQQWGDDLDTEDWSWGRKTDEFGTLHHLQLLEDKPDFQIMTVVFGEPISPIDTLFSEDAKTWGVPCKTG